MNCDSVVTLNLTVNYSTTGTDNQTVCDTYTWIDGQIYTASNSTATYTLTNAVNCDSVVTLNLTVNYSNTGIDNHTACDTYTWIDGLTYTASNTTATYTLTNVDNCDSVVTLNLTMYYNSNASFTQTACDEYIWNNHGTNTTYTTSGTYTNNYLTADGCPSTDTLNLTVNYNTNTSYTDVACDNYIWSNNGNVNTYITSGTYYSNYYTNDGCASTDTLYLTVNYNSSTAFTQTACDTFTWNNHGNVTLLSTSGVYFSSYNTADGCPSVDTLYLTVNYNSSSSFTQTACDNYTWNNNGNMFLLDTTGVYYSNYNTVDGCASVDTLYLTVNYNSSTRYNQAACDYYTWDNNGNSNTYTASGIYFSSYYTTDGCLSVDTLDLTVYYNTNTAYVDTACDTYTWVNNGNTQTYTTSGVYFSNYLTNDACPSVDTLYLTVNHQNTGDTFVYAHNIYTWYGQTMSATGTATTTLHNQFGCDSVVTLHLTIQHQISTNCDQQQGSTYGDIMADHGSMVTIGASPAYGFHFYMWADGVFDNPRVVTVLQDSLFIALFEPDTFVVSANFDAARGTVTGLGSYAYLDTATVTATPAYGYQFVMWDDGSTNATRTITVLSDTVLNATFMPRNFNVSVVPANIANGTTTGSGSYAYGTVTSISAVGSYGYDFDSWSDGNTDNPRFITVMSDTVFTANFTPQFFSIIGTSTDDAMGTVNGSGMYAFDSIVTLTAVPNHGYVFNGWADGDTNNPRYVRVTGNANYAAIFSVRQFHLTVLAGPNGMATGSGDFDYNSPQLINAVANNGYHFAQWNDGNVDNPRVVTILGDTTYTAQFVANNYTVRVASIDQMFGTATGSGIFGYNTIDTLVATPAAGYTFAGWSDGDMSNPRYLTVTSDVQLVAIFTVDNYRVLTYLNDPSMGIVTGAGSYPYNSVATITAIPNAHYHFVMWSDTNYTNPRNVTVLHDEAYTAIFAIDTHHVEVLSANSSFGTTTGTGDYVYGGTARISARPAPGYSFLRWNDGITANPRTIIVGGDETYTAEFTVSAYTVTTNTNDVTKGVAVGGGVYNYGDPATLMAQPTLFHHFVEWSDGNTANPRNITVYSDTTFTAIFEADRFRIDVIANDPNLGSTSGSGDYDYGDTVQIKASANPGYQFVYWSDGSTDSLRDVVVYGNETYMAVFEPAHYTMLLSSNDGRMGSVNGSGVYSYGDRIFIDATPNMGYVFLRWDDGNTNNPREITITSDTTIMAIFTPLAINIRVNCNPNEGHAFLARTDSTWVENDVLTYNFGDTVLMLARPRTGYHFVRWSDGSTDTARFEYALEDKEYYAFFEEDRESIDDVETVDNVIIYSNGDRIVVRQAEGKSISIFDAVGKCLVNETRNTESQREFRMPATGVYLVKVGNAAAKRVIIMK